MHAYGHGWACQLVYNPCMCIGLGLSDGEGTECLWSRFVHLIGVERSSLLKCSIKDQGTAAQDILNRCELPTLERGHDQLMDKVEVLYASLNIHDQFPELEGINLDFVRLLLMAHDLKMNICEWAITSFFKWDKLGRAVGSTQQALGTKLHQQTCKAITKCQPALLTAIQKFNAYCEHLEVLYDPSWGIPLPSPLSTKLAELCSDHSLIEDVWITPSNGEVPQWLEDADARDSICALLNIEADNLCHFFGEELAALKLALRTPGFTLSGGSQMPNLNWLSTTFLEVPDPEGDLNDVEFSESHNLPVVELEHAALADILEGDVGGEEDRDFNSMDHVTDTCPVIVWEALEVHQALLY
ncbi:hypothetical protein DFH29DRAFT_982404 [Suillus ampliporus]|nr:hypothetical protein DFH29DRAFT_982404 [Suillus ampliporus]